MFVNTVDSKRLHATDCNEFHDLIMITKLTGASLGQYITIKMQKKKYLALLLII